MIDETVIIDMPVDDDLRRMAADWSIAEWGGYFPGDTTETYLDLYSLADRDARALPVVLAAVRNGDIVGTASLVEDDELPGAPEPGPWVAAVYVAPEHRSAGVGRRLVHEATVRAASLGYDNVWLYTHDTATWYESMGWTVVRPGNLNGHLVTVMTRSTNGATV